MRKSMLRNVNDSVSPLKQEIINNSNVEDMERQWSLVKNNISNNLSSPLKRRQQIQNFLNSKTNEISQVSQPNGNFNVMKLVPHYKIKLDFNETDDQSDPWTTPKTQRMVSDSPINQPKVNSINKNDLKARQGSNSVNRDRQSKSQFINNNSQQQSSILKQLNGPPQQYLQQMNFNNFLQSETVPTDDLVYVKQSAMSNIQIKLKATKKNQKQVPKKVQSQQNLTSKSSLKQDQKPIGQCSTKQLHVDSTKNLQNQIGGRPQISQKIMNSSPEKRRYDVSTPQKLRISNIQLNKQKNRSQWQMSKN